MEVATEATVAAATAATVVAMAAATVNCLLRQIIIVCDG